MISTKHLRSLFGGHIATAQVLQAVATGLASAGVKVVIRGDIKIPHADPKTRKIFLPSQVKSEKALLVVNWWVDHEAAHLIWSPPYTSLQHRFKKIKAVVKAKGYPQVPTELMDMTHSLVNACEDARVENLMVERFPGCIEQFLAGPVAGGYDMQIEEAIQEAIDEDKKVNAFWIAQWHAHALLNGWHGSKQRRFIRHIAPKEIHWVLDIVEDNFDDITDVKQFRCEDLADRADVVMSELLDKLLEPPQPQPQMSSSQSDDQSEEGEEGEGQQGQGQGQPDPNQEEQEGQPPAGPSPFDEDDDDNNPATMPPPPSPKMEGDEEDGDDDQDQQGGGQDGEDKNEDKSEGDDQASGASGADDSEGSDEDDSDSGGGSASGDDSEDDQDGQGMEDESDDGSGSSASDDESDDDSNGDSGEGDPEDGDEEDEEDGSESEGEGSEDSEGEGEEGESSDGDSEGDGDESDDDSEGDGDSDGDDESEDGDEEPEDDPVDPEQARNDLMDAVKQMAQDARSDRSERMAEALQNEVDADNHNPQPSQDDDNQPSHGSPPAVTPASDFHARNMPDEYFEKIAGGAQIVTIEGDDLDLLMNGDAEEFSEYDDLIRRLMPSDLGPVARRLMGRFKDTYGPAYAGSKINPRMHQRIKAGTAFGRKIMHRRIEDHQSRKGVCVQMIIDCSGSMCSNIGGLNFYGGSKFAMAHAAARGLARYFQQLQVKFEVLGFTTDSLKDPDNPSGGSYTYRNTVSRSEDIINFVFKQFEEPWSVSEQRMLAMNANTRAMVQDRWISSSTNSDGESVLWAALRMLVRPEQEKIMLVLSDGLPWAGNSQMQSDFLAWVVWRIQEAGIKIGGLGLGSDAVANYYPIHAIVNSVPPEFADEHTAPAFLQEKIIDLVDRLTS